jgi:HPt (histidine-containing phosphotransfer) domain-containing protein
MRSSPGSIDTRNILSVCQNGDTLDRALLREMLDHFIHENERRMETSLQALTAVNRESLRQMAHAVRGSAAMIGAGRLHDLAWALEMDASTSEPPALGDAVKALRTEFQAVIDSLHKAHPEAWSE